MTPRLDTDDKLYVLKRYREGESLRGIGREIGRPDITVRRVLEAQGITFGPPKTSNKRSSPETEALALRLYDEGLSWAEINEQAGITSRTLAKILDRNGREYDRKPEGAEDKADIMAALHEAGHSARAIGRRLGHSKSTVCAILAGLGTDPIRPVGCENPDYFDSVDTPEKAYWLGFISADGCIITTPSHPDGYQVAVKLGVRDKHHLAALKQAVGAYATVRTGFHNGFGKRLGFASLAFTSQRLIASLRNLGIVPRKSLTLQPWDGPADLMPHYWRGMVDGDGALARKGNGIYTLFLCGSKPAVVGFTAWCAQITGTKAKPYFKTGCWYISISGRYQVPKLVRVLYGDAPVSLARKQEIADRIIAGEEPRKKPGPPRMEFASDEERIKYFRAQKAASQRRYMERKRQAEVPEP